MKKLSLIISILAIILLILIGLGFYLKSLSPLPQPSSLPLSGASLENQAVLSLQINKENYSLGEKVAVVVYLESNNNDIDGLDVVLNYNPLYLEPVEPDKFLDKTNSVFNAFLGPKINEAAGTIKFSALREGESFKGEGRVAALTFQTKKKGKTEITFSFEKGGTKDSNVSSAKGAKDILGRVRDVSFRIN